MFCLHKGHLRLFLIHYLMQILWNSCLQFDLITFIDLSGYRQILQSSWLCDISDFRKSYEWTIGLSTHLLSISAYSCCNLRIPTLRCILILNIKNRISLKVRKANMSSPTPKVTAPAIVSILSYLASISSELRAEDLQPETEKQLLKYWRSTSISLGQQSSWVVVIIVLTLR